MRAWTGPDLPTPFSGPQVRVFDTASGEVQTTAPDGTARLYVCGITPYDATHIGHANTFLSFDLLVRAWRSAGHQVHYVQNITDVDDPLLERAAQTGVDWAGLAAEQIDLFRSDMAALRVIPPTDYIGAVESIPLIVEMISRLEAAGAVYRVEDDLYFSVTADPDFGEVSGWGREQMIRVFPARGGDPDRVGKKDPLDCLLWRAERPGEPSWPSLYGPGRPGWHVECAAIATAHLGPAFDIQGGGRDLVFPHHEMTASEAHVVEPGQRFAHAYVHTGMVGLDGEKMSKSRGNLVFVSRLLGDGHDPMAIRLALLSQHYREDWDWSSSLLDDATSRLLRWRAACRAEAGPDPTPVVGAVLEALADDLDAPRALAAVDDWVAQVVSPRMDGSSAGREHPGWHAAAPEVVRRLVDASLGVAL